jgi:Uma2 family endonuclease
MTQEIPQIVEVEAPDISHIITEDDTPVDNLFSEHQQHLLADGLHYYWHAPNNQPFVAISNVGLYYGVHKPPLVPDFMLSIGVEYPENYWEKRHRTYLVWEFGKSPDLAVEIVSNLVGKELDEKLDKYAHANVPYYLVFDPSEQYGSDVLRAYKRNGGGYHRLEEPVFETLGLSCTLWTGEYAGMHGTWLRWLDAEGRMIPTGVEAAAEEAARAEKAESRASSAESRASKAELLAAKMAEKLKELGINPDAL